MYLMQVNRSIAFPEGHTTHQIYWDRNTRWCHILFDNYMFKWRFYYVCYVLCKFLLRFVVFPHFCSFYRIGFVASTHQNELTPNNHRKVCYFFVPQWDLNKIESDAIFHFFTLSLTINQQTPKIIAHTLRTLTSEPNVIEFMEFC